MATDPTEPTRCVTVTPGASPELRKAVLKQARAEGLDIDWRGAYLVISRNG